MVAELRFDEATLRKTQKLLDEILETLQKKVLSRAYPKALEPVERAAKQSNYGFTDRTGNLRGTIRAVGSRAFRRGKRRGGNQPTYAAAVIAGSDTVRTAHLLERGFTTRGGSRYAGTMFLERAFRSNISAVVQAFRAAAVTQTAKVLTREAKKRGLTR